MTYQVFNLPPQHPLSAAGRVLPGAKAYFFLTDSVTPVDVWTTFELDVAHEVPVEADAGGRFPTIYLDPDIVYKVTVNDANDVLLYTIDPVNDQWLSAASVGAVLYPRSAQEIAASVTPVNYSYPYGHLYRYGVNTTPGVTDLTTTIEAAMASNYVIEWPDESVAFTSFEWKVRRTIKGKGRRKSIAKQLSSMNASATPAISFETGTPPVGGVAGDIAEGGYHMEHMGFLIASQTGFYCDDDSQASFWTSNQCEIVSRQAASNGSTPYTTITDQRAIWLEAGGLSSVFFHNHTALEIRAFDIGIEASGGVNEVTLHAWFLDCRVSIRLNGCSTWNFTGVTVETNVATAIALQTVNACSNLIWDGGRWELPQAGGYGIEADGTTTGSNWRFSNINVLITGDGSAVPGLKWTGAVPDDFLFSGYDNRTGDLRPFVCIPNLDIDYLMPNRMLLGGNGLGHGRLSLGSNSDGGVAILENNGTNTVLTPDGSLLLGTTPTEYADDAAAAAGSLPVGGIYRTASALKVRVA
jgi:hypothetical protein